MSDTDDRIKLAARMLELMKESGATRMDFYESGCLRRVEFGSGDYLFRSGDASDAPVEVSVGDPQTEPGGYETALERMARGGKKEAPKT